MSNITVRIKKSLNEPITICSRCLDLLCLDGYIDSNFVISRTIFKIKKMCQLCSVAQADFIVIPCKRGIFICERCFRGLTTTSKHRWQSWPKKQVTEDIPCDLCGRPAQFHITLPKRK